jgi:uncharacterized protein YcbX
MSGVDDESAGQADFDVMVTIASMHVYPIKSCAGIGLDQALMIETGIEFDRAWMLVDPRGMFVTQRELPRMVLVQPTLKTSEMVLRAPGMLALHVALDRVEKPVRVTVWNDEVAAYDMGDLCAQWFSDFLGRPLRMVRFDPEHSRLSDHRWTGEMDALNAFADGFPILVTSTAALDELNRRLDSQGHPAVTSARFRPNLVLDGLDAHGEDALDEIAFDTAQGPVRIKLVKPCARCPMPDVNPQTAETGHVVTDTLTAYRSDVRLEGKITFGMNAVILEGIECTLQSGMRGRANYRFD